MEGTAVAQSGRAGEDRVVAAVLVALAGVRRGEAYAVSGAGALVHAALQAAAGPCRPGPVRLAVAVEADAVGPAAAALPPGARLVAVAAHSDDAVAAARAAGATLLQVVPLPAGVAWLARRDP